MVIQVSSNLEPKASHSEDVEEISSSDHNEPTMTLGETLSMKQITSTPLASVKEMQNLVGGTDIKVHSMAGESNMSIHFASVFSCFLRVFICFFS